MEKSDDVFVQGLYRELDERITELEQKGSYVEKMKVSDAILPIIVVSAIVINMIVVIISS